MAAALLLGSITRANGTTIAVGSGAGHDFGTIQAGIDAAVAGDTVLVTPGEYVITEPITFRGKAITVMSETGADETTIRMGTPADPDRASVVVFENNETAASVLDGFTITGGGGLLMDSGEVWAGGIFFNASSGTVKNCAIVQNRPAGSGGGVMVYAGASPTLSDCAISENTSPGQGYGGGVCCYVGSSAILTNCTLAENSADQSGGGVFCYDNSSMTLTNCAVAGNSAGYSGGGVFCGTDSSMTMTDCTIRANSAASGTGGGVISWQRATLILIDCAITENIASNWSGGGTFCTENASLIMTRCIITRNAAARGVGGAMECGPGSATFTNCVIAYNTATRGAGGLACTSRAASMTITNCTIWGNSAGSDWGGGGVGCYRGASATISNSILWANTSAKGAEIVLGQGAGSTLTISYSDVAGGRPIPYADGQATVYIDDGNTLNWGLGNIDANPLLAEAGYWADGSDPNIAVAPDYPRAVWIEGDYHLKSKAGRWDPISESWVVDDITSPCIDRGDPNSPVGEEPDPNGGIINIGAYGGTSEASMSIGQPAPFPPLAHWKLDEAEGAIAYDSIGTNDAMVMGVPVWWPEGGRVDGALELSGMTFIMASFVLNPADGPFSVLAWVKGGQPGQGIITQQGGVDWLCVDAAEGNLTTELSRSLCSHTVITDGDWHRIGVTWDGSACLLYVDDVLEAESTEDELASSTGGIVIGCRKIMAGTFFTGLIDDVRIYNRAVKP